VQGSHLNMSQVQHSPRGSAIQDIVPESPRCLTSKARKEDVYAVLVKYHANGTIDDPLVRLEFEEIIQVFDEEKEIAKSTGFAEFFQTKGNRHRLLTCVLVGFFTQWAGNGEVGYYLAPVLTTIGIVDPVTQAGLNLGLQGWNALDSVAGAFCVERFGRRPLDYLCIGHVGIIHRGYGVLGDFREKWV
jgi:hypothetical protein